MKNLRRLAPLLLLASCRTNSAETAPAPTPAAGAQHQPTAAPAADVASPAATEACDLASLRSAAQAALSSATKDGSLMLYDLRGTAPTEVLALGTSLDWSLHPASTIKPLLAWVALDADIIVPTTNHTCNGTWKLGTHEFTCYDVHGELDLEMALATSCNAYSYHVAQDLGRDRMVQGCQKLKLPGFATAFAAPANDDEASFLRTALGHNALHVTIRQLAAAYLELATSTDENAKTLRKLLRATIENERGTGHHAQRAGLDLAGKTGGTGVENGVSQRWFAGFAPALNPEALVVVHLQFEGEGEQLAPKLAADILQSWQQQCGGLPSL